MFLLQEGAQFIFRMETNFLITASTGSTMNMKVMIMGGMSIDDHPGSFPDREFESGILKFGRRPLLET